MHDNTTPPPTAVPLAAASRGDVITLRVTVVRCWDGPDGVPMVEVAVPTMDGPTIERLPWDALTEAVA